MNGPSIGLGCKRPSIALLTIMCSHASLAVENIFHLAIRMKFTQNKIASILRQHGYKITPQRRAVLNAIALSHGHLTPTAIYQKVHGNCPTIGLVTVYRTLDILAKLGLVCEVHAGGNSRSYLMRRPVEHHHHIICSSCGAVADFTDCRISELAQRIARETSFEIDGHLLEFTGTCKSCRKEGKIGGR